MSDDFRIHSLSNLTEEELWEAVDELKEWNSDIEGRPGIGKTSMADDFITITISFYGDEYEDPQHDLILKEKESKDVDTE